VRLQFQKRTASELVSGPIQEAKLTEACRTNYPAYTRQQEKAKVNTPDEFIIIKFIKNKLMSFFQ
jgi:hypothetical protein